MSERQKGERSMWHVAMTKERATLQHDPDAVRPVKVRGELAVERELQAKGFETYCPRFLDTAPLRCPGSKHKPRLVAVTRALFPGYVFVALPLPEDQVAARYARGVIDLVRSDEVTPLRVPVASIEKLKASEGKHGLIPLSLEQRQAWAVGDWARVLAGPFAGFQAQVDEAAEDVGIEAEDGRGGAVDRDVRIGALIDVFGRPTPVRIEPWHLERL